MIRFDYEARGCEGCLSLLGPLLAPDVDELERLLRRCLLTTPRLAVVLDGAGPIAEPCRLVLAPLLDPGEPGRGAAAGARTLGETPTPPGQNA